MPPSAFHNADTKAERFLNRVIDSALRTVLEERSPPDEAEKATMRKDLTEFILQAYSEGEREAAALKRIGLLRLWLKSNSRRSAH